MKLVENLDPTVEEVQKVISELTEIPMNKSMLVLKRMNQYEIQEASGLLEERNHSKLDEAEKAILKPVYVLAVSEDMKDFGIQPLDKVRYFRITATQGHPIPCSLRDFKILIVREYDVATVIKNHEA